MSQKKKKLLIALAVVCLIFLILLSLNVSISGEPWMAGGAVCISFDKWDMLRSDKIVIGYRGKTYTVTEPGFVQAFSKDTLSGTYSGYCCSNQDDGWVEIYRGDRLLRRMRYIANHEAFAYEADAAHWVLFGEEGHVFLSTDVWKKLHEIIGA
ncbi:MAG: hypothetical protein IKC09_08310 [Oscillospiraceae bacterium]|nr:hypothetical protein [Oscillospiraceae bacterium]